MVYASSTLHLQWLTIKENTVKNKLSTCTFKSRSYKQQLTACCKTNVPFLLTMTSSMALIEVSSALRPSSLFIVVVVTTYVGGAIRFI